MSISKRNALDKLVTNDDVQREYDESTKEFDKQCQALQHQYCEVCKKVSIRLKIRHTSHRKICRECNTGNISTSDADDQLPVWIDSRGQTRYDLPTELQDLREAEKLLISPLLLYVPLHHMKKGQIGCRGHVCAFEQDIGSVCKSLPRMPSDIGLVRVIKKYKDDIGTVQQKTFSVRRERVLNALRWLKRYSNVYDQSIVIDESNLQWMEGAQEKDLPPIKEQIESLDDKQMQNEDKGPSLQQVSTVVDSLEYHEETFGTMDSNRDGGKMTAVNKKIANDIETSIPNDKK